MKKKKFQPIRDFRTRSEMRSETRSGVKSAPDGCCGNQTLSSISPSHFLSSSSFFLSLQFVSFAWFAWFA